jgi:TAT-translocated FGD2 family F420-dependent dehydrogenase
VLSHEQFPQSRLVELGVRAEQAGFDMIWTSDHFHPWQHDQGHSGFAWLLLAALGQRMQIPMGTGVTCPTYRYHPAIVAQAFASLGALYPGRVFLGVGTGEAINEEAATGQWDEYDARADRLEEAITLIRELWTGDVVNHQGRFYRTLGAKLYTLAEPRVPIFVAASGENSMELAGRHGDGLVTDASTAADPAMRQQFEAGARAAGKDPGALSIHAESFVFVGEQSEAEHAARMWRFTPKAWTDFVDNPDPRAIMRQAHDEIPLDEVMSDWVMGSNPEPHIEHIRQQIEAGVTHIYIHSGQEDQERVIDFYGREVLPHVPHEHMRIGDLLAHDGT